MDLDSPARHYDPALLMQNMFRHHIFTVSIYQKAQHKFLHLKGVDTVIFDPADPALSFYVADHFLAELFIVYLLYCCSCRLFLL